MTLAELYEQIGGSYDDALSRLQSDALVSRFIVKFLDDQSCRNLIAAWKAGDEGAAFEAAHTAKGVCANLGITGLATQASDICEALRPGNDALRASTDVDALMVQFEAAYQKAFDGISAFSA